MGDVASFDRSGAPEIELSNGQKIVCDPINMVPKGKTIFISHSHSDHHPLKIKDNQVLSSEETIGFLKKKMKSNFSGKAIYSLENAETMDTNHILGSRALYLEESGLLYTGDYCMTARGVHKKKPRFKKCRALITDATYAMPGFRFPDFKKVFSKTREWIRASLEKGKTVFLTCSSATGKPQEIFNLVKEIDYPTYASPFSSNHVYVEYGSDLGEFQEETYLRNLPGGPKIVIVHPSRKYGIINEENFMNASLGNVTGIGYFNEFVKGVFRGMEPKQALEETHSSLFSSRIENEMDALHIPISDHSDYYGFLELIKQTRPEMIYFPNSHFRVPQDCLKGITQETGIRTKIL